MNKELENLKRETFLIIAAKVAVYILDETQRAKSYRSAKDVARAAENYANEFLNELFGGEHEN